MKKLTTLLALLLCIMMALSCAVAEPVSGVYVPGEITRSIIANAWQNGKMLNADLKFRLKADPAVLGYSEEEQQIFNAICTALEAATLRLGAGTGPEGNMLRLEAGATLDHAQGGNDVTVDAAANIDLYGVTLESSLLPGRKVTAKWETLLAMAGMPDSDINMLISLRNIDWASALPQIISMIESYLTIAAQAVTPYIETVEAWLSTLTTEVQQNVAATDGLPAAAQVINVYLCEKDVGNLISALADTLNNDATVKLLLDTVLAQASGMGGDIPTVAQLVDEMRSAASQMTGTESPIMLTCGIDETGMPLFGELYIIAGDGYGLYGCLIAAPTGAGMDFTASMVEILPDGSVNNGFSLQLSAADTGFDMLTQVFENASPIFGCRQNITFTGVTTGDGQPGLSTEQTLTTNIVDGSYEVQMLSATNTLSVRTADGGESTDVNTTVDIYADGQAYSATVVGSTVMIPGEAGSFTCISGVTESLPGTGIDTLGCDAVITASDYDPAVTASLAETALETSSADTMDALAQSLSSAAQLKAMEALQALPTELLPILMNAM